MIEEIFLDLSWETKPFQNLFRNVFSKISKMTNSMQWRCMWQFRNVCAKRENLKIWANNLFYWELMNAKRNYFYHLFCITTSKGPGFPLPLFFLFPMTKFFQKAIFLTSFYVKCEARGSVRRMGNWKNIHR